jgi:hypothetical protein
MTSYHQLLLSVVAVDPACTPATNHQPHGVAAACRNRITLRMPG